MKSPLRWFASTVSVLALLTPLVACADADEPIMAVDETIAAPGSNSARICRATCAWRATCGSSTTASACEASCQRRFRTDGRELREGYVSYAEQCFPSLSCSAIDDVCLETTFGVTSTPGALPEVAACVDRSAQCGAVRESTCFKIANLTDEARAVARLCNAEPCDRAKACLMRAFGQR